MRPTYFVIELSTRWLIALVVALALSLIMAFAFGYGAAWSVLSSPIDEQPDTIVATPSPTPIEERVGTAPTPKPNIQPTATATATPRPHAQPTAKPTQTPRVIPTKKATVTPIPVAQRPKPTATATVAQPASSDFYVQVLAGSVRSSLGASERKLADLGFDSSRQHIMVSTLANGEELFKLRIGPFPDRESAERVAKRMRSSGFKDAWVAAP